MLGLIICYLLTSVGFYLILAYFLQSKAKLKSTLKLKKVKINTKYFLYYNLIFYKNKTKENIINDYILYSVNKPIAINNFKYFNIDTNLNLDKIFLLKVNNILDIDFYKQFYSNFYNLNKKGINFIFLCKTDLIYNKLIEELMFNVFNVYNVKNISYSLFSVLNKANKNNLFLPISEINNKNVNIFNSYNYTVRCLNVKKHILSNNVCKIDNKTIYPNLKNQKFYLEYYIKDYNFIDKIYKNFGTNHLISYLNEKNCEYTFSYFLGNDYNIFNIIKYKGIKIYAYDTKLKKEILVLHLSFLKRFKYNLVYNYYNNKLYYYILITINLKNEKVFINNIAINQNEKIFEEKIDCIKNFYNINNITNISYLNDFYNSYLKQKILKNLVTLEKYYNINYLKDFNILNFEDNLMINKIDNKIIKSVLDNYKIENFIKLSKIIDPCILLYVINKIHYLAKAFKHQKSI